MPPTIVLASASPRRHAFLRQLGVTFETSVADIDETPHAGEAPAALATRLSSTKAAAVARRVVVDWGHALIIASDTVVAVDGRILGKPADAGEAGHMLRQLRGRAHLVHTAISVLATLSGEQQTRLNTTTVVMRPYADDEIAGYIATGDPLDKAGAYAIQHPTFAPVASLDGCFSGVMGFPLGDLRDLLAEQGVVIDVSLPSICEEHTRCECCQR